MAGIDTFEEQTAALDVTLAQSAGLVAGFVAELGRLRESMAFAGREVGSLSTGMEGGLRRAFDGLLLGGMKASDAMEGLARSIANTVYAVSMKPMESALGDVLANGVNQVVSALSPFAKGGAFSQGRVMPFAKGGVVAQPTQFAMRSGAGLMGEAGPEAIMPLARGPDGRLGVQAQGGGRPVTVVMNISTPDLQGFQRSQTQIAAEAARAMARGQRNR